MTFDGERQGKPALWCRGLVKRYGEVTALAGIDLDVRPGECFGLLGPNGAGKTTTVEIFEGLTPATEGTVEVLGQRWRRGRGRPLRERLGIQLQQTEMPGKLTVEETVALFASFFRGGRAAAELIQVVELGEKRRSRVEKLSGGQKQRLSLACALAGEPEVLFLDEPTTGLDPQARLKVWEIVESFRGDGGTVVLTTHYMEEAARLCDRLAILDHGKVIALETPSRLVASLEADRILQFDVDGGFDPGGLGDLPGVRHAERRGEGFTLAVIEIANTLPALLAELDRQQVRLRGLTTHDATLEDVFVHLTGRELRDG